MKEELFKKAIEKFGEFAQLDMLTEECGELLQSVNKVKRLLPRELNYIPKPNKQSGIAYSLAYYNACSEIADVRIMLQQLELIFDKESIDISEQRKLEKLTKLLNR